MVINSRRMNEIPNHEAKIDNHERLTADARGSYMKPWSLLCRIALGFGSIGDPNNMHVADLRRSIIANATHGEVICSDIEIIKENSDVTLGLRPDFRSYAPGRPHTPANFGSPPSRNIFPGREILSKYPPRTNHVFRASLVRDMPESAS